MWHFCLALVFKIPLVSLKHLHFSSYVGQCQESLKTASTQMPGTYIKGNYLALLLVGTFILKTVFRMSRKEKKNPISIPSSHSAELFEVKGVQN